MEYRVERWASNAKPDERELLRKLRSEGYRVCRWSDSSGTYYPIHRHGNDQSHWIITGSIEFVINEEEVVILTSGDRDFMPKGTDHSARVVSDEPVVYLIGERVK